MKGALHAALAFALTAAPALAAQPDFPFDLEATGVSRDDPGGCTMTLTLRNRYAQTVQVYADARMVDLQGASLAETSASFPPTASNGNSRVAVNFHNFKISGGACPTEYSVRVMPKYCFLTGSSSQLTDQYCKGEWSFDVRKRAQ